MRNFGPNDRLITLSEVTKIVPYHPVHIYRLIRQGKFPAQVRLGANRVAWIEREVIDWVNDRLVAQGDQP
jgi:prophage regulatory protein